MQSELLPSACPAYVRALLTVAKLKDSGLSSWRNSEWLHTGGGPIKGPVRKVCGVTGSDRLRDALGLGTHLIEGNALCSAAEIRIATACCVVLTRNGARAFYFRRVKNDASSCSQFELSNVCSELTLSQSSILFVCSIFHRACSTAMERHGRQVCGTNCCPSAVKRTLDSSPSRPSNQMYSAFWAARTTTP